MAKTLNNLAGVASKYSLFRNLKNSEIKTGSLIFGIFIGILSPLEYSLVPFEIKEQKDTVSNSALEIPQSLTIQSNSFLATSNPALEFNIKGEKLIRTVTAYYPVPWQTDEEPCISASGMNICKAKKKICASNEFPFGTRLLIAGEICEVQDRLHPKIKYTIDLFFKTKKEVENWGKRTVEVKRID